MYLNSHGKKNEEKEGISHDDLLTFCSLIYPCCISQLAVGIQPKPLVQLTVIVPKADVTISKMRTQQSATRLLSFCSFTFHSYCTCQLTVKSTRSLLLYLQTVVTIRIE